MSLLSDIALAIKTKLGGTSTNNTIPRYDGTTCTLKNSNVTISDTDVVTTEGGFVGNLTGTASNATLAASATKLETARTINGVSFNGTANITIADSTKAPLNGTGTSGTWNISITGNASTANNAALAANATKLATARFINGVSFDGTSDITIADSTKAPLNGTGATGTWGINITGNASTATNVSGGKATVSGTGNDYHLGGVEVVGNGPANTVFPTIGFHQPGLYASSLQLRGSGDFRFYIQGGSAYANVTANTFIGNLSGNATTATKLATARTINGVAFDGTADITVADSTKAPLASPALTGVPTAPTAAVGTNTTQIATTAFVQANKTAVTSTTVATATAGIGAGAVGSYAFLRIPTATQGETVSGISCRWVGITDSGSPTWSTTTLSGTWRAMGTTGSNNNGTTLCLRIA